MDRPTDHSRMSAPATTIRDDALDYLARADAAEAAVLLVDSADAVGEYDADAVANLLWPGAEEQPQREWVDGPLEEYAPSSRLPSDGRRSSGLIVDALVDAVGALEGAEEQEEDDEAPSPERSAEEQEEQRRQLDALEAQLAQLQAEKRVLCSELGPTAKPKVALHSSRLRAPKGATSDDAADEDAVDEDAVRPVTPPRQADSRRRLLNCPAAFICPITQEIFRWPVVASDGHSYERESIETWLASANAPGGGGGGTPTSPVTNLPLPTMALFPNYGLRSQVLEWREKEGLPPDDGDGSGSGCAEEGGSGEGGTTDAYSGLNQPLLSRGRQLLLGRPDGLPSWSGDDHEPETDDEDDDYDPFDLALAEAMRRSLVDQQQQQQQPGQVVSTAGDRVDRRGVDDDRARQQDRWNQALLYTRYDATARARRAAAANTHAADALIRARQARGLRPAAHAFGTRPRPGGTQQQQRGAWSAVDTGGETRRRSSACNIM